MNMPIELQNLSPEMILAAAAALLAFTALVVSVVSGFGTRRMVRRERIRREFDIASATITVTDEKAHQAVPSRPHQEVETTRWLRLTNTGKATAEQLSWNVDVGGPKLHGSTELELLHPGEQYNVPYRIDGADEPDWWFTVSWKDGNGQRRSRRRISGWP